MNNRYDEWSRREGRERDRGRERYDEEREDERSSREAQSSRSSFYPGDYGSQESGNWGRESPAYGQREPYNTSGSGGSTYGSSGYGQYRGEGTPRRGSGSYGSGYGREEFGRSRWGGPTDYGRSSRYSESQFGSQRRPSRETTGRDYGGGGYRSQSEDWNRDDHREYREGRYGSGDFGYEGGSRGEPSFGSGFDAEGSRSPRYFGMGNYGEGGSHFTGGYDQRGQGRGSRDEDYGYGYRGSSGYRGESGYRSDWGDRSESRGERPGLLQRLFKRGPKGYQRSDERLREDISERLMQSHHVDSSEVTVTVSSGKVTLDGTVPDRYMKHYIEDLVDACPGVQDIDNRVRVDPMSGQSSSTTGTTGTSSTTGASATGTSTGGTSTGTSTTGTSTTGLGSNGGRRKE